MLTLDGHWSENTCSIEVSEGIVFTTGETRQKEVFKFKAVSLFHKNVLGGGRRDNIVKIQTVLAEWDRWRLCVSEYEINSCDAIRL